MIHHKNFKKVGEITIKRLQDHVLRIRQDQIRINKNIFENKYPVPIHLALGHEAICVAVNSQFSLEDQILLTHRNLHYHLAFGVSIKDIESSFLLVNEDSEVAKLGSMNLTQPNYGNIYTSNILGNNLVVGLGVAISSKITNPNSVTWIVTGDGAIEEGAFYESILNASSLKLKIIYIIENNSWSLATSIEERRSDIKLQSLCEAFDVGYTKLSGNDVVDYSEKINEVRNRCTKDSQPQVVEVELSSLGYYQVQHDSTFRIVNYHSGFSKVTYDASGVISQDIEDPVFLTKDLD